MKPPKLSKQNIHVWVVNFDIVQEKITRLHGFLSEEEIIRASKFRFKKDKISSIISRGTLRFLSGKYLEKEPGEIKFKYGEFGKPEYNLDTKLKFNISHSGKVVVLGFVLNDDIGIDIEEIKTDFDVLDIASNYFSNKEIEFLRKTPVENHVKNFYRCWTRKEAFIKAKSQGLSFPLDSFSVSINSDEKAELLETLWDKKEKDLWQIIPFETEVNYKAALAVKGQVQSIKYFNFNFL